MTCVARISQERILCAQSGGDLMILCLRWIPDTNNFKTL